MLFYLGADGGQTHSLAILSDGDGRLLGVGQAGPCNHYDEPGGKQRFQSALQDMTIGAFRNAGVNIIETTRSVCYGLTGNWFRAEKVVRKILNYTHFQAVEDTITAHAGALAGQFGVVLIAGTGMVAFGVDENGRSARSGGLGYILSDEGGGFDIGQQGLRAAFKGSDGRGPSTLLTQLMLDRFHVGNFDQIASVMYAANDWRMVMAHLTPLVVQAASDGDHVAVSILNHAAKEIGVCAISVVEQFDRQDLPICYTGGVFNAGKLILDPLCSFLKENHVEAQIIPARYPPVYGALILAYKADGVVITDRLLGHLDQSLNQLNQETLSSAASTSFMIDE